MSAHILPRLLAAAALFALPAFADPALAEEGAVPLKTVAWSFDGPLGTFDRPSLQRGFQVFKEVCSSCHTLHYIAFRNLADPGGPGFSTAEVKAIAAAYQKDVLDDTGQPKQVPRTPADGFPDPFPNEPAARAANGGALPPDLSLITHAREGGPDYIHSLLTGYKDAPPDIQMRPGMNYNEYFAGHQIGMPFQLADGRVTYGDGTAATSDQMMEERKRLGLNVMVVLSGLAILLFWSYRRLWHDKH
jgi:cytochrome c1